MHLIFLHGVPGVGKRTIAMELSQELGFPFLDFQNLGSLLGPVFGYASPNFTTLRDEITDRVINMAIGLPEDGIIASFNDGPGIPMDAYRGYIDAVRESGGIGLFVGLTCDEDELKERADLATRRAAERLTDFQIQEEADAATLVTDLPGPSIVINTSGESPEQTVQNIIAMLPDGMKSGIMF